LRKSLVSKSENCNVVGENIAPVVTRLGRFSSKEEGNKEKPLGQRPAPLSK